MFFQFNRHLFSSLPVSIQQYIYFIFSSESRLDDILQFAHWFPVSEAMEPDGHTAVWVNSSSVPKKTCPQNYSECSTTTNSAVRKKIKLLTESMSR